MGMGTEIPAMEEEQEANRQSRGTARSVKSSPESEQIGAVKQEEEVETEEIVEKVETEQTEQRERTEETEETEEAGDVSEEEDGEIVEAAEESEQNGAQAQQQQQRASHEARELRALKARPSVLVVGPPAVGKRSLVSRLVARGRSSKVTSETGATGHGWTIDTKYYTANVSMWMARLGHPTLEDTTSINAEFGRCEALIMVFDLSSPTSFEQLQEWAKGLDLENFEIRLCTGNKADRVPEHFAHTEYRRKLQKKGESSSDPHPEFWDFGIDRTEGNSLLDGDEESADDRRRSCVEWCSDNGFEYIESCAIDEIFDECMTVDGDLQGVPRIHGALSAHMWPGLVMKDGDEGDDAATRSNPDQEMTSDDDSDYYMEYELLSNGSAEEPWDGSGWEEQWSFSSHIEEPAAPESSVAHVSSSTADPQSAGEQHPQDDNSVAAPVSDPSAKSVADGAPVPQTSKSVEMPENGHEDRPVEVQSGSAEKEGPRLDSPSPSPKPKGQRKEEWEDMEQLMSEMASMRVNMRSMSDQHRRETAARLALRMASMFKEDEDGESDLES